MKALIDGDVLVYRIGYGLQTHDPLPGVEACYAALDNSINCILKHLEVEDYQVYITGVDNFRFKRAVTKEYKGNRKDREKPIYYNEIRERMITNYKAIVVDGMEADDQLGIDQTDSTIICTIDKDLDMIPGWHYNLVTEKSYYTDDNSPLILTKTTKIKGEKKSSSWKLSGGGILWFYAQMLLGDVSDNIPGIKGYGPLKVFKTLKGCKTELDMIKIVYDIYKEKTANPKDRFLEIADLLWIRRENEDFKNRELEDMLAGITNDSEE